MPACPNPDAIRPTVHTPATDDDFRLIGVALRRVFRDTWQPCQLRSFEPFQGNGNSELRSQDLDANVPHHFEGHENRHARAISMLALSQKA
jgi:hypothetical protein